MDFNDDSLNQKQAKPAPYVHQPFPSWRYHRSGDTMLVNDQEESDTLANDPDWSHTPATFFGHSAPSRAQLEEEARQKREANKQSALAAAKAKGQELAAANAEIARLQGLLAQQPEKTQKGK